MGYLLTLPVRVLLWILQHLPLIGVVRLGRAGGEMAWWLLGRHRRIALANLTAAFGTELAPKEIRVLARENFRRLGENYASAVHTAALTSDQLDSVLEVVGADSLPIPTEKGVNLVIALGHFGNFELYARIAHRLHGWKIATTYRALRPPALNALLVALRARSGSRYFERTSEARALREYLLGGGVILGLLADQHGGAKGLWLPFFGRPCSTNPAPAVLAQRYRATLQTAFCYRIAPGRWRIEFGPPIPTFEADGTARASADIMQTVNLAFETAIRRDPANWFWVHRRWKPPTDHQRGTTKTGFAVE